MSQSAKTSPVARRDAAALYLEALEHVQKLVETQPPEKDKSAWRKWARELMDYEAKTLTPREKRAPRLTKYSDGVGERFLAAMKAIEATESRLKNGRAGPSSSGESEPDEPSTSRRSSRRMLGVNASETQKSRSGDNSKTTISVPNFSDVPRTINHEVPCGRCARAGFACSGKEGRACFNCRAHRQRCDLISRSLSEKEQPDKSDKGGDEQDSVSAAVRVRLPKSDGKENKTATLDGEKEEGTESTAEMRGIRPRRAATLLNNRRVGSPRTITQVRGETSSPNSILRKRRATDADLSIASSAPPGPSPSKRPKPVDKRRDEEQSRAEPELDREEVRDALLVCEAAFRQLRKALRL
ncbi:uncharacterized protein FOMMEDRAFT_141545 [Fomitiporia mediterranea MF3/22]|uniref:uncharacterized protein n=1 Tax=Fomitiporia mediterranea (strain MF3/22) TaxID=694068 RepID=UPI00044093F6|nr:uncharacterized protein FOMMEDRAFT_141545 [Fomitiporia mediterranea MF3/22]EJD00703.1 hypothetical protein FOMMEDRAFT_141545 [Fomitiporia mediterranea MF3/22]